MPDKPKQSTTPPPISFKLPLLVTAIAFVILGVIILILGKLIIAALLALFGAVLCLGAQVAQNNKF